MRWVVLFGLVVWLGTVQTPLATASHGGPETARMLGWDARDQKVYFEVRGHNESGYDAVVFYFDLRSKQPETPQRVGWSVQAQASESDYATRYGRLVGRLTRLELSEHAERLSGAAPRPLGQDSVTVMDHWVRRFRTRVRLPAACPREVDVVSLGDDEIHIGPIFHVRGRPWRVVVISFRGVPWESLYEAQVPVLLQDCESGLWAGGANDAPQLVERLPLE